MVFCNLYCMEESVLVHSKRVWVGLLMGYDMCWCLLSHSHDKSQLIVRRTIFPPLFCPCSTLDAQMRLECALCDSHMH
jgi:hypothetical protein